MSITVWTSEIKCAYLWSTALKEIYVWTTKIRPPAPKEAIVEFLLIGWWWSGWY